MSDPNILNMSDEELLKLDPATLGGQPDNASADEKAGNENSDKSEDTNAPTEEVDEQDNEQKGQQVEQEDGQPEEDGKGQNPVPSDASGSDKQADKSEKSETTSEPKPVQKEQVQERDYKAELERVLSPIKANGREIKVSSVDDAIQLMQMGANYHKKMAAIKPNLAVLKLLEEHGLLDQQKLSYLIDLEKKNPDAIKKLVKDSGIDPLDIDTSKADTYKPNTYSVDESAVELDAVLEDLKSSPRYGELLNVVGKEWDSKSRRIIADTPDVLRILDSHMNSGIFDKIMSEVETNRALGRLVGMSDLEAYRTVGDRLQSQGAFNGLGPKTATAQVKVAEVRPATKTEDSDTKGKKLAASTSRATKAPVNQQAFNILAMSDDELLKLDIKSLTR